MDAKDLEKIIKLARKNGITHLKCDGVEISFLDEAVRPKSKDHGVTEKIEQDSDYSEEDILYWSVQQVSEKPEVSN